MVRTPPTRTFASRADGFCAARYRSFAAALVVVTLIGCENGQDPGTAASVADAGGSLAFRVAPPRTLRAVDRERSVPILRVGGRAIALTGSGGDGAGAFVATERYPRGTQLDIVLDWEIDALPVWRAEQSVTVTGDTVVRISADSYLTSGLDADTDGHSNFDELMAGSDPHDVGSTPDTVGPFDELAGEWGGGFVVPADDFFVVLEYPSIDEFFARVAEGLDEDPANDEDIVLDLIFVRIDTSGTLTLFDRQNDEYAEVASPDGRADCVVRIEGTVSTMSDDVYAFDSGGIFPDDPVRVVRRQNLSVPALEETFADVLVITSSNTDAVLSVLVPYSGSAPLDSQEEC